MTSLNKGSNYYSQLINCRKITDYWLLRVGQRKNSIQKKIVFFFKIKWEHWSECALSKRNPDCYVKLQTVCAAVQTCPCLSANEDTGFGAGQFPISVCRAWSKIPRAISWTIIKMFSGGKLQSVTKTKNHKVITKQEDIFPSGVISLSDQISSLLIIFKTVWVCRALNVHGQWTLTFE